MSESQNIEWKQSWRDEYLKWICGFANAQGGRLYIGCDDDGNVVGAKDAGYYTNAAMLLFCKNPDKWLIGSYTKIGFFETDADIIYQDEIHGSILEQIDQIIEVMHLKYMKAKITYEGVYRTERYFVPDEALREALLNALCHKQYESCVPIQVSVYEDKIYIGNCCNLPPDWTADDLLKKHT